MKDYRQFKPLHEAKDDEDEEDDTFTKDEDKDKDTEDEEESEDDEEDEDPDGAEASKESEFIDMFTSDGFAKGFKSSIKQYVTEKILTDEFNDFTVIPYVELSYKDDQYGLSVEFESAATINIDEKGKVIETDIPDVESLKYQNPGMDKLTDMDSDIGKDTISVFVIEALKEIKKVPR